MAAIGGRGRQGGAAGTLGRAGHLWHPLRVGSFHRPSSAWILVAAASLCACEQRLDVELRYPDDSLYKRHSFVGRALEGPAEVRYPNGVVESAGLWRDGLREGIWTMRHPGGGLRARGAYRAGLRVGSWEEWREDGSLVERGLWVGGARDGVFEIGSPGGERLSAVWEQGSLLRFEPRP